MPDAANGRFRHIMVVEIGAVSVKAEEIAASQLFLSGNQLQIPLWQRHFSWEKPQWAELWADLVRVRTENLASHFLGSVVLKALPWTGLPSEAKRFQVVDGQQRITALTLLICAIRDRLAQLKPDSDGRNEIMNSYTSQLLSNVNLKTEHRERLVLQEKDRNALAPIVDGGWSGAGSGGLIDQAYSFFRDRLRESDEDDLLSLFPIILAKFSAVWVTLEEGDNAHRVFQTLNAGGKKLKQSDLVRNYFFLLLGELGDSFYEHHWRSLEGDLNDRELEEFLVAWSITQGHTGGKDSLFHYFHQDLRVSEHDPNAVLEYGKTLTETAQYFRWIRQPGDAQVGLAKQSLRDLRNWSTLPAEGLIPLATSEVR